MKSLERLLNRELPIYRNTIGKVLPSMVFAMNSYINHRLCR
ncbi:MAG: hypothetical protein QW290_07245 [Sulfolobales archaeon]